MPRNHPIEQSCRPLLSLASYLLSAHVSLYLPRPILRFLPVARFRFAPPSIPHLVHPGCSTCTNLSLSPFLSLSLSVTITLPDLIILHDRDILFSEQKSLTGRRLHGSARSRIHQNRSASDLYQMWRTVRATGRASKFGQAPGGRTT